jgi:hypothetical protein
MVTFFKKLFSEKKEEKTPPETPGRIFNRILTGKYFGCSEDICDEERIKAAKQEKIKQIKELGLFPKFKRYLPSPSQRSNGSETYEEPRAVHIVFQKEAIHNSMIHITEISFIVKQCDFEEFEQMSGVSLEKDFRDLTDYVYNGEERRKEERSGM